jgi:transcriptional regulator
MYIPGPFASPDDDATLALIDRYGFGQLVTHGADGPMASHLPMQLDRTRNVLIGHLAGPNPQTDHLAACEKSGTPVLAMFEGPHGYVSPSWYAPTNKSVPTWNYAAAHVYGVPRLIRDKASLHTLVAALAQQYERLSWRIEAQDPAYIDMMLGGIVGFELAISRIEGKFKLSQNRNATDRANVIAALAASGNADDAALGHLMQTHLEKGK